MPNPPPCSSTGSPCLPKLGSNKGTPFGPLLFSLALQPLSSDLKARLGDDKLDMVSLYLDDCVLAGNQDAIARAFSHFDDAARRIGLRLNASECKFVPASGKINTVPAELRPRGFAIREGRCMKLLGAPIGDRTFCNDMTTKRAAKAQVLLDSIASLDDPQVALLLLRQCASFGKLVYSGQNYHNRSTSISPSRIRH